MTFDLSAIRAISFDCYGTLIDWESGILGAVEPVFATHHVPFEPERVLEAFARHEREVEAEPYLSYAAVLGEAMQRLSREFDLELGPREATALFDSMPSWRAFEETAPCLRALGRRWKLAIVSNVDDDVFEYARKQLEAPLAVVVTAQQVQSYKPRRAHFDELLRRLNLEPSQVLHVAESRFHDVAPAGAMGFPTVWVNRRGDSSAASASGVSDAKPEIEVRSLRELCERLGVPVAG